MESLNLIEKYIEGKDKNDFLKSKLLQDSIIRRIDIIGEAVKNLSIKIKEKYNRIPWKEIAGMRDILVLTWI